MKSRRILKNIFAKTNYPASSRGVALILVTFVVALASIVVVNLTYSTYLAARANAVIERSLFAEYLMKSGANIARAFLLADKDFNSDGPMDPWAAFRKGMPIPLDMLGINEPNLNVSLELIAENQKFPIQPLVSQGTVPSAVVSGILVRLFQKLGFDSDNNEVTTEGQFKGTHFSSEQMVSNLIDYCDPVGNPKDPNLPPGVESQLPKDFFPNKPPTWITQLRIIPGFTPNRMRKLEGLLTPWGRKVNPNFAPRQILESLSSQLGSSEVDQLITAREGPAGPLDSAKFVNIVQPTINSQLSSLIDFGSEHFQVISKVEFGVKSYFLRVLLDRNPSTHEILELGNQMF